MTLNRLFIPNRPAVIILVLSVFMVAGVGFLSSDPAHAMYVKPCRIILNSQLAGAAQDVEAVFSEHVTDGWLVTGKCHITMSIDDKEVAEAVAVRYCSIDDILFVEFDRETIQTYLVENELAGEFYVWVNGWYEIEDSEGNADADTVDGGSFIEVLSPGNR